MTRPRGRRPGLSAARRQGTGWPARSAADRVDDDRGSILLLTIACCALGLAVVLLVADASSLYLARVRLFSIADAAALAGAESFDVDGTTPEASLAAGAGAEAAHPVLTDGGVADSVTALLADEPADELRGLRELRVDAATAPEGRSARVTLSATWTPPLVALLVPDGVRIDVTSTARSVLVGPGSAITGQGG